MANCAHEFHESDGIGGGVHCGLCGDNVRTVLGRLTAALAASQESVRGLATVFLRLLSIYENENETTDDTGRSLQPEWIRSAVAQANAALAQSATGEAPQTVTEPARLDANRTGAASYLIRSQGFCGASNSDRVCIQPVGHAGGHGWEEAASPEDTELDSDGFPFVPHPPSTIALVPVWKDNIQAYVWHEGAQEGFPYHLDEPCPYDRCERNGGTHPHPGPPPASPEALGVELTAEEWRSVSRIVDDHTGNIDAPLARKLRALAERARKP